MEICTLFTRSQYGVKKEKKLMSTAFAMTFNYIQSKSEIKKKQKTPESHWS